MSDTVNKVEVQKQNPMALGQKSVIALFLYYLLLLVLSTAAAVAVKNDWLPARGGGSLLFCVSLAAVGATVFYSRKLYKACISNSYNFTGEPSPAKIGTLFFFILRPIFATVFAGVTHMIWEATIISSVHNFSVFSSTHLYFSGILGFFVGFLTGRVLTRFESIGDRYLEGI